MTQFSDFHTGWSIKRANNLTVVKLGGNIISDEKKLTVFLKNFSRIARQKILIHGGGSLASELSKKLGIKPKMHEGRRITDQDSLKIGVMAYAGLINKQIVSQLQSMNCNALGLSGADGNAILAKKRPVKTIDYEFVGDLDDESVHGKWIETLMNQKITPIFCAITHDGKGQLLNTNADTIASTISKKMANMGKKVRLVYCFEKLGVLSNIEDDRSLIETMDKKKYIQLRNEKIIFEGMIPKLDNAFESIDQGVSEVVLCNPDNVFSLKLKTTLCL